MKQKSNLCAGECTWGAVPVCRAIMMQFLGRFNFVSCQHCNNGCLLREIKSTLTKGSPKINLSYEIVPKNSKYISKIFHHILQLEMPKHITYPFVPTPHSLCLEHPPRSRPGLIKLSTVEDLLPISPKCIRTVLLQLTIAEPNADN